MHARVLSATGLSFVRLVYLNYFDFIFMFVIQPVSV